MLGLFSLKKNDAVKVHFVEIANAFQKLGHPVAILIPAGFFEDSLFAKGITIHRLPVEYRENLLNLLLVSLCQIVWYVMTISAAYQVVYVRWRFLPTLIFRAIHWCKSIKPLLVTEHNGWAELEVQIQRNSKILGCSSRILQVIDARSADLIVAVTEGIKDYLVKYGVPLSKIQVIGNGTNIEHYFPQQNYICLKQKLFESDGFVLGFAGNISRWQGVDELLQAFIKLRKNRNDVYLLLIGSGVYLGQITAIIKKHGIQQYVLMKENLPYHMMNDWLNIMDIAFAPKSKALDSVGYSPLKIRDYAACGIPVISTNVQGIKELKAFGWLKTYDSGQQEMLDLLLEDLLNQPDQLQIMGKKAREFAEKEFSWHHIAQKIASCFDISESELMEKNNQ